MNNNIHTENIDEDGIITDRPVETYYCPLESISIADGYIRVLADNDATDVETRIAFETLIQAGWTPPIPRKDQNERE